MAVKRIAGIGFWIVCGSVVAIGQQSEVVRHYPLGTGQPLRTVETRTDSGGREVVTRTVATPNPDGRLAPSRVTTTETTRTGATSARTTSNVIGIVAPDEHVRLETTRTERETLPDGSTRTVISKWIPDLNNRLVLTAQEVQHTRSVSPDVKQTDTSIFRAGINEPLVESERIQETERQIDANVHRIESTWLVRDLNGRFQPTESWSQEVRTTGPSSSVAEEAFQRLDINGKLTPSERIVTQRSEANGQGETVVETFSTNVSGIILTGGRMELTQRVRRTTESAGGEGGRTVEDVEERVHGSSGAPIRQVRRTIGTMQKIDADRWGTTRQVYTLDLNDRLVLTLEESGVATGKPDLGQLVR